MFGFQTLTVHGIQNFESSLNSNNIFNSFCCFQLFNFHLQGKPGIPTATAIGKVGAELNSDPSDNIPLRIMLLFMDEVFDLQERNQWLRRQIVSVLRQLVKAMFGNHFSLLLPTEFIYSKRPKSGLFQ